MMPLKLKSFQLGLSFTARNSPLAVVLIMIPAMYESLVDQIREKKEFDSAGMTEEFYRAAQYLYQTEPCISKKTHNRLKEYISYEPAMDDLFLVELNLFEEDERFAPNVNPLDRYDAFMSLLRNTASVKISDRLRMEAYGCVDWYIR